MENKKQMVLDIMKKTGEPMRPGNIAEMTGLTKKEISELISDLKKENLIFSPKRCFYAPVEEK